MNRERQLAGPNSYARELRFHPLDWLRARLTGPAGSSERTVAWLDLCCGTGHALAQAAWELRQDGHRVGTGPGLRPDHVRPRTALRRRQAHRPHPRGQLAHQRWPARRRSRPGERQTPPRPPRRTPADQRTAPGGLRVQPAPAPRHPRRPRQAVTPLRLPRRRPPSRPQLHRPARGRLLLRTPVKNITVTRNAPRLLPLATEIPRISCSRCGARRFTCRRV